MPDTSLYPRVIVDAPTPEPAWYGLLSIANMPIMSDTRWQNGAEYQPLPTEPAHVTTAPCAPYSTTPIVKSPHMGISTVYADPFTIYEGIDITPVGIDYATAQARAVAALTLNEQRAVEATILKGVLGNTPTMASSNAVKVNGTTAVSVSHAARLLESAIGVNYGGRGVIHIPRGAGPAYESAFWLVEDNGRLRTKLGTYVVAGSGYDGTAPGGAAPAANQEWWYATGMVTILRSEVFVPTADVGEAFARGTNDLALYAERTYVAMWDAPLMYPDPSADGLSLPVAWAALVDYTL